MTWLPSRTGRPIDLIHPVPEEVDFSDLAWSLAHLNRYGGHGELQVSVGLHTLIGCDLAPESLRPWWLLHDAAESRIGEMTTPAKQALVAIADALPGSRAFRVAEGCAGAIVRAAWREFELRHDIAIHAAAGLAMPTLAQLDAIKTLDRVALATEHRDFHRASERPWQHERDGIAPASRIYRFKPADKVADELHARFRRYLPALSRSASALAALRA